MTVPDRTAELRLFLDICARVEGLFAQLYHSYSRVYASSNPEAARLWKKTALEEENHVRQAELALKMLENAVLADGVLHRARQLCQRLSLLVVGVSSNPPTLEVALKKAIEMEEALAYLHVDCAIRFATPEMQKFFQALREADQDHVGALRRQLSIETLAQAEMGL